jgi:hypothetical protein
MKTFTKLQNLYTSLSNNTSTTNVTLGAQLINDQHRYLLEKYFDNERQSTTTTVGGMTLTITAPASLGDVSATLSVAWAYPTNSQLVNFSNSDQRTVLFTAGSTAITWTPGLSSSATTTIKTVGVQGYTIPANISKIKNLTVNVGQLKYQPREIMTRQEWDLVNFLPYTSDIPQYYFVYNRQFQIFPIPSTTGNIITYNYKTRVADMTYSDYTTPGTINTMAVGGVAVTGTSTTWASSFPTGTDLSFVNLALSVSPTGGDGIWYPILSFTDNTNLTLIDPVINAPSVSGATFTIGQLPLLSEDFHDMLVFGALKIYFSSIAPDTSKFKEFDELYKERLIMLASYAGTKAVDVDLGTEPQVVNPNLFIYAN